MGEEIRQYKITPTGIRLIIPVIIFALIVIVFVIGVPMFSLSKLIFEHGQTMAIIVGIIFAWMIISKL